MIRFLLPILALALLALAPTVAYAQKLEPGDAFTLDVPRQPFLQVDFTIDPNGLAVLPMQTQIVLAGVVKSDAERRLRDHYELRLGRPLPGLRLIPKFSPNAPIRYSGALTHSGSAFATFGLTLAEVLDRARPKASANLEAVEVRSFEQTYRPSPSQFRSFTLRAGDHVFVPERAGGTQVFVLGSVRRPGAIEYEIGLTVRRAIELAGGALPEADLTRAEVRRKGELLGGVDLSAGDAPLAMGDVVQVPRIPQTEFIYVVGGLFGSVRRPFRPNVSLLQAIDEAGGVSPHVRNPSVVLTRLENGRITRQTIRLADLRSKAVPDVPLRPGDRIELPEPRP